MNKRSEFSVFVLEDNEWYRKLIAYTVELNPEYKVKTFGNATELMDSLSSDLPRVITLDYFLPDAKGEEVLRKIKEIDDSIEVVIISEQESIQTAVDLLQQGAYDYIVKSKDLKDRLLNTLKHIFSHKKLQEEVTTLRMEVGNKYQPEAGFIGSSSVMRKVYALMDTACKTNISVVVTGETGTGKEMVAKSIHYNGKQKNGPFVAVNMAAIPEDLIESELFGHTKGAFTGATNSRKGKFEEAIDGTLFLDEIGEMDLNLQSKLLRALQEKEVTPVGSNKNIKINSRVVVATNKNLVEEVKQKRFREDLYYRLYGITIELPPLRKRENDVILLSNHFVAEFCKENDLPHPSITTNAQKKLMSYQFPGNVRELKSVMELAAAMSNGNEITEEHIQFGANEELFNPRNGVLTLKEYTDRIIKHYLDENDGDVKRTAEILDISYSTIYRMLKKD